MLKWPPTAGFRWKCKVIKIWAILDYYSPAMLGLKIDQEVLEELVKVKAPAVGQLMAQYPGIWTLVVSRWFICLYIDILPIEVKLKLKTSRDFMITMHRFTNILHVPSTRRQSCGCGIVFSTKAPRFFSVLLWPSSFTTSQRSCELALCPTCASALNRLPVGLSPWTATPSCRWDEQWH